MKLRNTNSFWLMLGLGIGILFVLSACQSAPAATPEPMTIATPSLAPSASPEPDLTSDCSVVEGLRNDSVQAQQTLEEFIQNFKKGHPTEYMGMAVLDRVDRLGGWAVVQGSVSGDDRNILVVHQTSEGYQLVEDYLVVPSMVEEKKGAAKRITQYFWRNCPMRRARCSPA